MLPGSPLHHYQHAPMSIVNVNNLLKFELYLSILQLLLHVYNVYLEQNDNSAQCHAHYRARLWAWLINFRRAQARNPYRSPLFKILPMSLHGTSYTTFDCLVVGRGSLTLVRIPWRVGPDLNTVLMLKSQQTFLIFLTRPHRARDQACALSRAN